jgi:phosphoserine phosphatase
MTAARAHIVFDFDLTLIDRESFAELMARVLDGSGASDAARLRFTDTVRRYNSGKAGLGDLLFLVSWLQAVTRRHVSDYIGHRCARIDPVLHGLIGDLLRDGHPVHILSSGYREWVSPIVEAWGIAPRNVTANGLFWLGGRARMVRPSPLHSHGGKSRVIRHWRRSGRLDGPALMIGDGPADYAPFRDGLVQGFVSADYYAARPQALDDKSVRRAAHAADLPGEIESFLRSV